MTETKLFQYAIIWNPSEENKENNKPKVLKDVTTILASDEKKAFILASREIPKEYLDQLDNIQIVVKVF